MSWAKLIHRKVQKEAEPLQEPSKGAETKEGSALTFKEFYPVNPPFGYVGIQVDTKTGKLEYLTIEPTMTIEEKEALARLKTILMEEANIPLSVLKDEALAEEYLASQIKRAIRVFNLKVAGDSCDKFVYYVKRDLLGYGILDVIMRDINIEDVSCNGTAIPIYVWHRYYESIPTNVSYPSKDELDAFVTRLAYKVGHQVSVSRMTADELNYFGAEKSRVLSEAGSDSVAVLMDYCKRATGARVQE